VPLRGPRAPTEPVARLQQQYGAAAQRSLAPSFSIFHDPDYLHALGHSLELAAFDMAIATPLGVLLAIGLARWRGRGSGAANGLMLVPLVTPEIVMAVSLLLVFTQLAMSRSRSSTWGPRRR
jgi:ABC-type spermidine/putrescine transport system permease subunit II